MSAQKRLKAARKKRRQIASHLIALEKGKISLEEILQDPPKCLGAVSVYQVMLRTPKLGPQGIKKCLTHCKIWPEDKLATLTAEQRELIVKNLPPRAKERYPTAG